MGLKYDTLNNIVKMRLNTHNFCKVQSLTELREYANDNKMFTIRFDRNTDITDLPFVICKNKCYMYNGQNVTDVYLYNMMQSMGCTMLCSNGLKYDKIQICNFVYKWDYNDNFIIELSFDKVPLRVMYKHGTIAIRGNIKDSYDKFIINTNRPEFKRYISKTMVEKLLNIIISDNIRGKYCECTLYPKNVGRLNLNHIYWQIIK